MRNITKMREPRSLTEYRHSPDSSYEDFRDKDTLRVALVTEQRGLCCYCMNRIHSDQYNMKIEHWQSQYGFPDRQLDYHNLLGACKGGEGKPPRLQHCDTRKGEKSIKWNPADPSHFIEKRLFYRADGAIFSDDVEFDDQLNNVLNLNLHFLKNNRKKLLDGILDWWKSEKIRNQGPISLSHIERHCNRIINENGELEPYCQVIIWWLEKRKARMQQ